MPVKFQSSVMQVGSSLRITIPQELARHLNINKADSVEIWADNHNLIIEKKIPTFNAIWAFSKDIKELRKNFIQNIKAHTSQPLGIPLHKYKGTISIERNNILLSGINTKSNEKYRMMFSIEEIKNVSLDWDDILRRWKDTRAWIRPLRLKFKDGSEDSTLYIYSKKEEGLIYGGENKTLFNLLKRILKV